MAGHRTMTRDEYAGFKGAFDWFNTQLFGGKLPACLITLQRKARSREELEEYMPRYNVTVAMTLKITKVMTVRAKDEETATQRVDTMISDTHFGTLSWEVFEDKSRDGWTEEELNVTIEDIEEE